MEIQNLFSGEEILTQSNKSIVTLTTHRIRYNNSESGSAHIVSMLLENLSSIEVNYKSNPVVLALGVIIAVCGIIMSNNTHDTSIAIAGLAIGAVLILYYFRSRKHIISIASNGGAKIQFETGGMKRDAVIEFINKIETAKHKRSRNRCNLKTHKSERSDHPAFFLTLDYYSPVLIFRLTSQFFCN